MKSDGGTTSGQRAAGEGGVSVGGLHHPPHSEVVPGGPSTIGGGTVNVHLPTLTDKEVENKLNTTTTTTSTTVYTTSTTILILILTM